MKCGAATVRAAENGIEMGEHATPHLRPHLGPAFRGIVRNQAVKLWAFCCTSCGYVELQLLDPAAIAFVTERWIEVPPPAPTAPPPPSG